MTGAAFIDTETTGLDADRCPVWEIAVIVDDVEHCWTQQLPLCDFTPPYMTKAGKWFAPGAATGSSTDPVWRHCCLPIGHRGLVPGEHIDQWVIDNTGINERYDHREAMAQRESIERFRDLVAGRHLVGAVPSFDEERLRRQLERKARRIDRSLPWDYHVVCVETLATGFLRGQRTLVDLPKSGSGRVLSDLLGVPYPEGAERHSALGDARWAKAMFEAVMS